MMIAVPILALQPMPQRQPRHVAARIFPSGALWPEVRHTVDKALPMEGEH